MYLVTTWHYIKQVYGIGRLGAAYHRLHLQPGKIKILRFGLYPLWFLGAAPVLVVGANYDLAGFDVGFGVLPSGTVHVLRVVALAGAVPVAAVFLRVGLRTRGWPPSLFLAPYVAAFLWLAVPPNQVLVILLLAPFHALQYLTIGHRAELALAGPEDRDRAPVW